MSRSLSGLKKLKYDKEHELVMYENTRADLKTLLAEGEKITPKAWRTEKEQLEKEGRHFGTQLQGRVTTLQLRK